MSEKKAIIYLCKGRPSRSGGGLGVAYNYLTAIWGKTIEPSDADHILVCGEAVVKLGGLSQPLDEFLAALDVGTSQGAMLCVRQASLINGNLTNYSQSVVLGFSPYYLWPLIRRNNSCRVTFVHSEHGKGGRHNEMAEERGKFGLKERFVRWCVGFNFRHPDRVIFPSRGALNLFTGMNADLKAVAEQKAAILYNGVTSSGQPAPREAGATLRMVSVAHHVREKGLDFMLDALRMANAQGLEWELTNYGQTSDLTEKLVSQARESGIHSKIEFAGLKPQLDVRAHLARADVFLHTPTIVVFDLSLLEAMMQATPVVTTPLEGNREALGEDYPLYASTREEVVEKLKWISNHREEAYRIGQALRERALNLFTNEAMVGHYHCLLQKLITL